METFAESKDLMENPQYAKQRQKCLSGLTVSMIDTPIIEIVTGINILPYCFTLQSCYGHFLYSGQNDPTNINPLPVTNSIDQVEYRIAYLAFCIENSKQGKELLANLREITLLDPENIQLGSAEWFWKRNVNSYALQVEPERFKYQDKAILNYKEALQIEKIRNEFYNQLTGLLQKQID